MKNLDRQAFICEPCAEDLGREVPEGHMPTWNVNECEVCKEVKEVTQFRDFSLRRPTE